MSRHSKVLPANEMEEPMLVIKYYLCGSQFDYDQLFKEVCALTKE